LARASPLLVRPVLVPHRDAGPTTGLTLYTPWRVVTFGTTI